MSDIENKFDSVKDLSGNESTRKKPRASILLSVILIFITFGYLLFSFLRSYDLFDFTEFAVFNTVFISILFQALPFMFIGTLVSSAMHVFIPDRMIVKAFPTRHGIGFLTAMFMGIFFPVCECAIVPVMTRLVKKGVALPIAITFMLSAPIINPIVIISTLYAFYDKPFIALARVVLGLLIALLVGLVLLYFGNKGSVLLDLMNDHCDHCSCCNEDHEDHEDLCEADSIKRLNKEKKVLEKIKEMFKESGEEFFNVGKYLIIGAFITSLIQTLVSKDTFMSLGSLNGVSLLIMMAVAFLFSACSTSDAFLARSFMNKFTAGSIMGFLVFGPMMDLKNLLMLLANFKKRFVIKLSLLIFILNFVTIYFFSYLL